MHLKGWGMSFILQLEIFWNSELNNLFVYGGSQSSGTRNRIGKTNLKYLEEQFCY
jgi:hypothetical protein